MQCFRVCGALLFGKEVAEAVGYMFGRDDISVLATKEENEFLGDNVFPATFLRGYSICTPNEAWGEVQQQEYMYHDV